MRFLFARIGSRQAFRLLMAIALAGCATRSPMGAIPKLERQRDARPEATKVLRALGIAYYKAGRWDDAKRVLTRAHQLSPNDGTTALYLGLADEQRGDLAGARDAYASYLTHGRTSRVRGQLRSHLAALARKQLETDAKLAVAQENTLAGTAGPANTVAVLPLTFNGGDTTLASLGVGLADLMITDLSRSSQLTVVERGKIDALLDELSLSQNGAVDARTAVRSGKLARAGRLVRGAVTQLDGKSLRADAAVVNVATARTGGPVNADFGLDAIFDAEKKIVLALFADMGITLTPAERAAVDQRPTRSLAAFLAYSRGLREEDGGRLDEAARFFGEASRIDPGFNAARSGESRAQAEAAGSSVTPATVEASLAGTPEGLTVAAAQQGDASDAGRLASTLESALNDVNPSPAAAAAGTIATTPIKNAVADATNTNRVTDNIGKIIVVVPIPLPQLP
jgi:tetratricopeptide (TPR) repeat protein